MEDTLHYNLLAAQTQFQKAVRARLRREFPELLPGQPKIIDFLLSHPSSFQREIAEGCLIEPATLSPILEKMELGGLIRRGKAEENRKNSLVTLTARGEAVGHRIRMLFAELEGKATAGLTAGEHDALLRTLRRIRENSRRMVL